MDSTIVNLVEVWTEVGYVLSGWIDFFARLITISYFALIALFVRREVQNENGN